MAIPVPRIIGDNPETRRFLDTLARAIGTLEGSTAEAPSDASYLTLGTNASLSSERVLTAGTLISFADGGAGSTLTISGTAAMTFVNSATATSGSTASITGIPACKMLLVGYKNISHNNGANQTLRFALSVNNGSSYSAAQNMFSTALAAGVSGSGILKIMRMDQTANFIFQASFLGQILGGVETATSGTVNAIQFSWSAGDFDDAAGAFYVYYI